MMKNPCNFTIARVTYIDMKTNERGLIARSLFNIIAEHPSKSTIYLEVSDHVSHANVKELVYIEPGPDCKLNALRPVVGNM